MGSLTRGLFSEVNTTVLHGPVWVEPADVEEPGNAEECRVWRADYKFVWGVFDWVEGSEPLTRVVQVSAVVGKVTFLVFLSPSP